MTYGRRVSDARRRRSFKAHLEFDLTGAGADGAGRDVARCDLPVVCPQWLRIFDIWETVEAVRVREKSAAIEQHQKGVAAHRRTCSGTRSML